MNVDSYFNSLIELQSKINDILNNDFNQEEFETYLSDHINYLQNKRSAMQLFSSLNVFISIHPQYIEYPKKLILSPLLRDTLSLFSSFELYQIFTSFPLRLALFEHNFIKIDTIIERSAKLPHDFAFFMPEIEEADPQYYIYSISRAQNRQILHELVKEKEKHKELREKGRNHHHIAEVIRNDDIQQFQEIISQTNLNLNSRIPYSFYEDCQFINKKDEMPQLIDFASFFNSINIFKFLWINEIRGSSITLQYAIAGGNYEIIHLLESVYKNGIQQQFLNTAITFHRNDIFSYLQDTYEIKFSISEFSSCIDSYNTEIFVNLFPQAFDLIMQSEFKIYII